ncbi:MAG: replicative DNA helicase [Clostridia bacterium]|nr:replicative DNA helicase [Clostridia bacterium]
MAKATKSTTDKTARRLPFNFEAEQAVLGAVLISQEAPTTILTELKKSDFFTKEHQIIFDTMQELFIKKNHTYFDYIILTSELEIKGLLDTIGGVGYLITLANVLPSATNYNYYVEIVKRDSILRKLISAGGEIIENAYSNDDREAALGFAESKIYSISQTTEQSALEHIRMSLEDVVEDFELCFQNPDAKRGMPTGFPGLDHYTNGFQKGDLIILAARPSFGKSSLAVNFVQNAAVKYKKTCAIFSLEMPRAQLARRMACSIAKEYCKTVSMEKVLRGDLNETEQRSFRKAVNLLAEAPIFIDDNSNNTPAEIKSKCMRLKNDPSCGLDFVMIDYLQLMSSERTRSDSRQQEVSDISRNLKIMAKELGVPVLALSQLSRAVEQRTVGDHKPQLSDLRETGAIEQDADIVMFIHRPSRYADTNKDASLDPTQAFLILAKHRNGPLGEIPLIWDGATTTFRSTEKDANIASLEATAPPPILPENKAAFEKVSKELEAVDNFDDNIFDEPPIDYAPPIDEPMPDVPMDIPPEPEAPPVLDDEDDPIFG